MPKPTTGRITPKPPQPGRGNAQPDQPDVDQMTVDTLMTSVFTGVALIVATVLFAVLGVVGAFLADSVSDGGWQVGLGFGLVVGSALIVLVLRTYADRIRARSANLYRGAWIGSIASLVIIVLMAYVPQVAFPRYCPPGAICQVGQP